MKNKKKNIYFTYEFCFFLYFCGVMFDGNYLLKKIQDLGRGILRKDFIYGRTYW